MLKRGLDEARMVNRSWLAFVTIGDNVSVGYFAALAPQTQNDNGGRLQSTGMRVDNIPHRNKKRTLKSPSIADTSGHTTGLIVIPNKHKNLF